MYRASTTPQAPDAAREFFFYESRKHGWDNQDQEGLSAPRSILITASIVTYGENSPFNLHREKQGSCVWHSEDTCLIGYNAGILITSIGYMLGHGIVANGAQYPIQPAVTLKCWM